jgi:hypothetical protein
MYVRYACDPGKNSNTPQNICAIVNHSIQPHPSLLISGTAISSSAG